MNKILITEDDMDILDLLATHLVYLDFEVEKVYYGKLSKLQSKQVAFLWNLFLLLNWCMILVVT